MNPNIFSYIKDQEASYETEEVQIGENWYVNTRKHVQLIFHLMHGVFFTGANDWTRIFKQIMRPLIRLSLWTEDLEVKDVTFYIENSMGKVLSFFVKKYHDEVYVKEHDLDKLFDEISESDIVYGGVLVQKGTKRPEVKQLLSIAFCDQTDTLGGPIGFKINFAPEKLREMAKYGWGEEKNGANISIEDLIVLATDEKGVSGTIIGGKPNESTGKNIETYVVMGNMPDHYLKDNNNMEYYCYQLQIVGFYTKQDGQQEGVVLYRKEEDPENLKFFASEPIHGWMLGYSDGMSLLHNQIWTNWDEIKRSQLKEAGSVVPLYTDDPTYSNKNKIQDMENLEITTIADGKRIYQVPTISPANIQILENDANRLLEHAQFLTSAQDPILGKEAASGTTFRGQERSVAQGRGWHDRRRGQRAKFIEDIYRTWIIPDIKKEILKGKKFLSTLSTEELSWVAEQLTTKAANEKVKEMILKGKIVTKEEQAAMTQVFKQDFLKKGNKHLLEILKDEFADIEIKIGINVAGKQKDLVNLSDKLLSIFQFIFANPAGFQQAMQIPALAKSFENLLEFGGMSIADFSSLMSPPDQSALAPQQPQQGQPAPELALGRPQ